jgi:tripartite-type tricarboxylate transporter receptor subunit TctC
MTSRSQFLGGLASTTLAPSLFAQATTTFPSRPLSWVVPYPTGGFGDSMSRLLVQKMSESLEQTVLVESRPGGAARIAANHVKLQPADGHTLPHADIGPLAMYPSLYSKLSFDPLKDFAPLTRLFSSPLVVAVAPDSPFKTFADLLRAGGSAAGLTYGSYGIVSQPHVWTEQLRVRTSSRMTHVPYQGVGPALQDLMGGRLNFMADVIASSLPFIRDGKLRALATVGAGRRPAALPNVPRFGELGHTPIDVAGWNGVMVRAGTPPAVVDKLHTNVVAALQSPESLGRYAPLGLQAAPLAPAAFGDFIRSQTTRWKAAIRELGVKVE